MRERVVKFASAALKAFKYFTGRSTKDVMNFMDLIFFILAWEEWKEIKHFKEDTTSSPYIHLIIVITIS